MRELITEDFAPLAADLDSRVAAQPGYSAQLAIYHRGRLVLSHTAGDYLAGDALACVYSVTKGLASLVIALLVQEGKLDPEAPVNRYWPEFAAAGKGKLTVGELLSHQGGVLGVPGGVPQDVLLDSSKYAAMLAELPSYWPLGQHIVGYHSLSMGTLMEELVRRVTGEELKDLYERRIRGPLGVDAYLGQPASLEARFRPTQVVNTPERFLDPFSLSGMSLNSRAGFDVDQERTHGQAGLLAWANKPSVRAAGPASLGAVADAQALAGIFAASFGPVPDLGAERGLLSPETWSQVSRERVFGIDRISGRPQSFALGFAKGTAGNDYGSIFAYGHDGANSSLAFADPAYHLAFAYLPSGPEGEVDTTTGVLLSQHARTIVKGRARA
ncbi:beta-lactamase family protein [Glutamicibacter sp. MNS18]|uniref:serine hydrolase domain-containing protein n=1 Tax=Glutamicibacter sp. MNS18 TaxID=2989817 RepID=UPI002235DDE8|nr:serine hydrolase domain-containing protein [Glutamicibacter sp. MNS18]MCW4467181.1 beta-lactamase family protein [Glutamicibacter sp. MNS18]